MKHHTVHAFACIALTFLFAGCGAVVSPQGDGGSDAGDSHPPDSSGPCGTQPTTGCVYGSTGGGCGDVELPQVCDNGTWHCPAGMIPASECRCFGRPPQNCVCTASGWQCAVDAGVDSGTGCPPDPSTAAGTACSEEGRTCGGPCTDVCSFCNILRCQSGQWTGLEVFPDPRCGENFQCGPSDWCIRRTQYCSVLLDDTGGPTIYQCRPAPTACGGTASCMCVTGAPAGGVCTETSDGAVTVTTGGG